MGAKKHQAFDCGLCLLQLTTVPDTFTGRKKKLEKYVLIVARNFCSDTGMAEIEMSGARGETG